MINQTERRRQAPTHRVEMTINVNTVNPAFAGELKAMLVGITANPAFAGELKAMLVGIAASILNLKEIAMATKEDFEAGFGRVDAATTQLGTLIRTLIDRPLSGMSAADEDVFKAKLEQVATSLEAMAATPTDPVPVPVPDPVP